MNFNVLVQLCIWCGRVISFLYGGNDTYAPPTNKSGDFGISGTTSVTVDLDLTKIIARTSHKYLSVGLPPVTMLDHFKHFNINSTRAGTLLKGLSPAFLRIGGTEADILTFKPPSGNTLQKSTYNPASPMITSDNCHISSKVLALYENADMICRLMKNFTISGNDWDTINEFAFNNDLQLLFGFSALKRATNGKWDPENAKEILDYTIGKKYQGNLNFELGNEPNSYKHKFNYTLSAHNHARDFMALQKLLQSHTPYKVFRKSLIVGPDITQPNKKRTLDYVAQFLKIGGKALDKITWHHYYLSSKSASTSVKNFTDPKLLDSLQTELSAIQSVVDTAGFNSTRMWIGETATASGGGLKGVSDRYVAGFMWLDKLGMAAQNRIELVIRQTFYSGHYALVDNDLNPLPDYWLSWVYKQLVGVKVINVTVGDNTRETRIYGHCSTNRYDPGSITLYGMNLNTDAVIVNLPENLTKLEKHFYLFTPHGSHGITAKLVNLNGKKLELVNDVTFPEIHPKVVGAGSQIIFPAQTFGFIVIPNANVSLCL